MKNFKSPLWWLKYVILVLVLFVISIGAVELAVCSWQNPELYQRITAPVREGLHQAEEFNRQLWERLSGAVNDAMDTAAVRLEEVWDRISAPPEPEVGDIQMLDEASVTPPPRPIASFTITNMVERDGQDYLTGGAREVVYFEQTSERWAEELYGTDPIGGYGCGPTAMAMAVSTLTDTYIDPARMAQKCVDLGCWAKKQGSYRTIANKVSEEYGLVCESLPLDDPGAIRQRLSAGQLVVALMGPGHFTSSGHFILLRGVTMDNSILVADPASPDRSLTTWDLDLILEELSPSRHSGGPMWVVYPDFFQGAGE